MSASRPSNTAILGQQSLAKAAKKKARQGQIEEVVFDDAARRTYLTGFHKRKMERDAAARRKAIAREKAEKIVDRKERKIDMVERARRNRLDTERAYGNDTFEDDFDPMQIEPNIKGKAKEDQVEFEDEEVTATVTVVEEFDVDELLNGPKLPLKNELDVVSESLKELSPPPPKAPVKMKDLMKKPEKRVTLSYETGAEKRDRLVVEKKRRMKQVMEAKTRKPKKRKDDGGRKRPSQRKK